MHPLESVSMRHSNSVMARAFRWLVAAAAVGLVAAVAPAAAQAWPDKPI
jgi:hypothetical protein